MTFFVIYEGEKTEAKGIKVIKKKRKKVNLIRKRKDGRKEEESKRRIGKEK